MSNDIRYYLYELRYKSAFLVAAGLFVLLLSACNGGSSSTSSTGGGGPSDLAQLLDMQITPVNPTIALGAPLQMRVIGRFSDDTTYDITDQVSWSSSDEAVATIDSMVSGKVNALTTGQSTISANVGSVTASTKLTVNDAALLSLHVVPDNATLVAGNFQSLSVIGQYSDGSERDITESVSWESGDSTIADEVTSTSGHPYVVARMAGNTYINASLSGKVGRTSVTVSAATLDSVTFNPADISIAKGTDTQLHAIGHYSNGLDQDITSQVIWAVNDDTIATVSTAESSSGLVSGLLPGNTTVTVTLPGGSTVLASTSVTVTDAVLQSITVTPATASVAQYAQTAFTATGHYSDNSSQDLTSQVVWTTSSANALAISNASGEEGVATGVNIASAISVTATMTKDAVTVTGNATAEVYSDPATPASLTIVSDPDLLYNDGIDSATLTVSVKANDATMQVVDGTQVDFSIVEGSGSLSAASALTSAGKAQVTLTSSTMGTLKVRAAINGIPVENYVVLQVTNNFADSLAAYASVSAMIDKSTSTVKAGSQFYFTVTNYSNRTYTLERYEFVIGNTVEKTILATDSELSTFHSGKLPAGYPLSIAANLTNDTPITEVFVSRIFFLDPATGKEFSYTATYNLQ